MNPNNSSTRSPGQPQSNATPSAAANPLPAGNQVNPLAQLQAQAAVPADHAPAQSSPQQEALLRQSIEQARQIVATTALDPYTQIQELERLKATYINNRFGKNIKISDS